MTKEQFVINALTSEGKKKNEQLLSTFIRCVLYEDDDELEELKVWYKNDNLNVELAKNWGEIVYISNISENQLDWTIYNMHDIYNMVKDNNQRNIDKTQGIRVYKNSLELTAINIYNNLEFNDIIQYENKNI